MVNYPHKLSKKSSSPIQRKQSVNFANRGMTFEKMINESNHYYLSRGLAVIHKKPTPIQIVKVDYPHRIGPTKGWDYIRQASTTDYSGVYKGHYIDFEAKETQQKQSMPMKNFHQHQIDHMAAVLQQGGICFVLLHFAKLNETYLLPAPSLIDFYNIDHGSKSMPLTFIQKNGYRIETDRLPSVPYLDIIEQNLLGGN